MQLLQRWALWTAMVVVCEMGMTTSPLTAADSKVSRYARFQAGTTVAYGVIEGEKITQIEGDLFGSWKKTSNTFDLKSVKLLVPTQPSQVLAMAGNYKSHLKNTPVPEKFQIPQAFFKSPSCLIPDGAEVVIPPGTNNVHFEAELVVVIGKLAKNVPEEKALDYVFGVTCGNDISARDWQKNDIQWWRAKGSDTFGPCGPIIVSGINYDDLRVQMRVNGKVLQDQSSKDLIHSVSKTVSFLSQHITLHPGDLIYTGTPGETSAIKPGDVMEVDVAGIGVLKNKVAGSP